MSKSILKLLISANVIAFLGMVTVNALANALPINGRNTGEISGSLPNLFVPAGLTFAIWGLIYLLLGIWATWQLVAVLQGNEAWTGAATAVSWWFVISSLANIGWILAWHYGRYPLSLVLMLVIAVSLIKIYLRIDIGQSGNSASNLWMVKIPFSVYLGWITVATVANVTAVLVHLKWNGFGLSETLWAIVVIAVAAIITILILLTKRDFSFSLVILWAFMGIVLARLEGPNPDRAVAISTIVAGSCVVVTGIIMALRKAPLLF